MIEKILEDVYGGTNDIFNYLEFHIGKRFIVVKDSLCKYVGLFDVDFLSYPIMSNSKHEKISNLEIIENAKGDVLIGGFGLGLIVLPIMNKPEVTSVQIVELHSEVIDLVAKQLPLNDKVEIINHDIFTFKPTKKYDTMFFDTVPYSWNTEEDKRARRLSEDEILSDEDLIRVYAKHLNDGGFCSYFQPKGDR